MVSDVRKFWPINAKTVKDAQGTEDLTFLAVLAYPLYWLEVLILSCYLRRSSLSETGFFAVAIMRAFLIWIHQGTDEKWIVFCDFSP